MTELKVRHRQDAIVSSQKKIGNKPAFIGTLAIERDRG